MLCVGSYVFVAFCIFAFFFVGLDVVCLVLLVYCSFVGVDLDVVGLVYCLRWHCCFAIFWFCFVTLVWFVSLVFGCVSAYCW